MSFNATPSIRRHKTGMTITNGIGKDIAFIHEDDINVLASLTTAELHLVNLVADNFNLFYENVIEEET